MIIRFNGSETIYVDGIHPVNFLAGQEAELPERIAAVLLTEGRASLPAAAIANLIGAPENKMAGMGGGLDTGGRGKMRPDALCGPISASGGGDSGDAGRAAPGRRHGRRAKW